MRYYIADCHFFHENLNTQMDHRGFENAGAMNAHMLEKWNTRVRKRDEVIILGDLSFGGPEETHALLQQLNGKLFLVEGNHDMFLRDKKFSQDIERFEWILPYKEIHDAGRKVILSHYPIPFYNGQYYKDKTGHPKTYMLYGHVHNTKDESLLLEFQKKIRKTYKTDREGRTCAVPCQMINCFAMFSGYTPLTLDEWIRLEEKRESGEDVLPGGERSVPEGL